MVLEAGLDQLNFKRGCDMNSSFVCPSCKGVIVIEDGPPPGSPASVYEGVSSCNFRNKEQSSAILRPLIASLEYTFGEFSVNASKILTSANFRLHQGSLVHPRTRAIFAVDATLDSLRIAIKTEVCSLFKKFNGSVWLRE